jgi:hypothetical protein
MCGGADDSNDDGVKKWIWETMMMMSRKDLGGHSCIYRFVDEDTFVDEEDATVQVEAPIDGFVYLYSRSSE